MRQLRRSAVQVEFLFRNVIFGRSLSFNSLAGFAVYIVKPS